jgi:aspartyl-tRNA(Asn)/glutamyl-tRNA(Gln) amidotransferase subunit A
VAEVWHQALEWLEAAGWEFVRLADWPDPRLVAAADAVSWTINSAEAAAFHEPWLEADPESYGADIRERLELGRCLLASEYLRAQRLRRFVQDALEPVWERVDALLTPACPTVAFSHGTAEIDLGGEPAPAATSLNRNFRIANLTAWPAIAVPVCLAEEGLPAGIQLIGPAGSDVPLLELVQAIERCFPSGRASSRVVAATHGVLA